MSDPSSVLFPRFPDLPWPLDFPDLLLLDLDLPDFDLDDLPLLPKKLPDLPNLPLLPKKLGGL